MTTNRWENVPPEPVNKSQLELAVLERDAAKAETQRWIRRMTVLEARLEKIRELVGPTQQLAAPPADELPDVVLAELRETHRMAPKPFLPMGEWTQEARAAAADFYQIVHEAFPTLIARAEAQREVYSAGVLEGMLRESTLTEEQKQQVRAPKEPPTEAEIAYGREVVAPRINLQVLRDSINELHLKCLERGGVPLDEFLNLVVLANNA